MEPDKKSTIFVSIPSYRDPECVNTVADCFEKATYPERVFVGVFQQNDQHNTHSGKTPDCMASETAQKYRTQIRSLTVDASEAKGPVYARSVIEQKLFAGEDYVLGIDSHTVFAYGWDESAIEQLTMCDSERPILSCYPAEYELHTRDTPLPTQPPQFLKFRDYHPKRFLPQFDRVECAGHPSRPMPSTYWAAGFSFASSRLYFECPVDPLYHYVFLGEEISMACRLFTNGWDVFSPITNIVLHYSPRDYRPTFWEQIYKLDGVSAVRHDIRAARRVLETQGHARVKALLNAPMTVEEKAAVMQKPSIAVFEGRYGLGTARTMEEFQFASGLDLTNMTHERHSRWGLSRNASEEEQMAKFGKRIL